MSLGNYGPVVFEVSAERIRSFDDFKRKLTGKNEEHEIIGRKSKMEFIAPGIDEVSFQMVFSAFLGLNPKKEIEQLREIRQKGEYHPLILAGDTLGNFMLESLQETWKHIDNQGHLLHAAVDISMKEYVETDRQRTMGSPVNTATAADVATDISSGGNAIGLTDQQVSGLAAASLSATGDKLAGKKAAGKLCETVKNMQTAARYMGMAKNKDVGGLIGEYMKCNPDTFRDLGFNPRDLLSTSLRDPGGTIIDLIGSIGGGGEKKYNAAKEIYGGEDAASILQMARQLPQVKAALKGGKLC